MGITKKLFVLSGLLIFYFYFSPVVLARGGSESLFVSVNKPEYAAFPETIMKVKVFEYQSGYLNGLKKFEAEINDFLSQNHKIEQIFQTSAGAGAGNCGNKIFTIITVFYK